MKVAKHLGQIEIFILHEVGEEKLEINSDVEYAVSSSSSGDDDSSEVSLDDEDLENLNDDELLNARRNLIALKRKGNVNSKCVGIKRRGFSYNVNSKV